MRFRPRFWLEILAAVSVLFVSSEVRAYTVETSVTAGCHEAITEDAFRLTRAKRTAAVAIAPTSDEAALIDDLPFSVPDDFRDLASATLLVGVRDNDLKGRGGESIDQLTLVHGDPSSQLEHCLRAPTDDEPTGTRTALDSCRGYIHDRVASALSALDETGAPDPNAREGVAVYLSIRGSVTVPLPTFYVEIGRALHAVEDGFTHDLRSSDGHQISVTLNWVDYANGGGDESRDGPQHMTEMDRCDDPDPLRATRHLLATEVAEDLLLIALDTTRTKDQRLADTDTLLTTWFSPEAGCSYANDFCNAPELAYESKGCGCQTARGNGSKEALALIVLGALGILARRKRSVSSGRASSPHRSVVSPSGVVSPTEIVSPTARLASAARRALWLAPLVLVLCPRRAFAQAPPDPQPPAQPTAPDIGAPPANKVSENPVAQQGVEERGGEVFGHVGVAGAFEKPAVAAMLGAKLALDRAWMLGIDAELNPFLAIDQKRARWGTFNAYASILHRYQMRYEAVNLRTTLSVGTSTLLMDLYGAPHGTTGIYVGVSFLGIEWKLAKGVYLVVDPTNVAIAAPQLGGVPFAYPQYRFTVGMEFGG